MQDGLCVVEVEGDYCLSEILHYAAVYGQDGPCEPQMRVGREWWPIIVETTDGR